MSNNNQKVKNFEDLKNLLKDKFQLEDDDEKILQYVTHNNYYTLGMYWYKFQDNTNLSLAELQAPYFFDQELSLIILKHLLTLEVSLKSVLVNKLSVQAGHYWPHLDLKKDFFKSSEKKNIKGFIKSIISIFMNTIEQGTNNNKVGVHYIEQITDSRYGTADTYIKEFDECYNYFVKIPNDSQIKEFMSSEQYKMYIKNTPLFVIAHFFDFRRILNLYRIMCNESQEAVAQIYGCASAETFETFISYMIFLRNRCAHPTRNYPAQDYKEISQDKLSTLIDTKNNVNGDLYKDTYLFRTLAVLQYFLKKINPYDNSFCTDIKDIINKYESFSFPDYEKNVPSQLSKSQKLLNVMGVTDTENIWKESLWNI